jgi:hypothetical protein
MQHTYVCNRTRYRMSGRDVLAIIQTTGDHS